MVAFALGAGCSGRQAADCPGLFNPGRLSRSQLEREGIGRIPERGSTTLEVVRSTIERRRGWIKRNYPGVEDVASGEGWGVTYVRDQFGNITYKHADDHMIVVTMKTKQTCPDPDRGTLLILTPDGLRVPVRFAYRST